MELGTPKGTRDFTPPQKILREEVFARIERVFQKYGFDPIETPIVENWSVLKGKYGEEAEQKLLWRFSLPYSKREYALRYDLTVPLARFYARYRPPTPFKRYQIGQVYRYDNPQKGRYREFYQCDADIVGAREPLPDVEIIDLVSSVFREFGLEATIRVNDRRLLSSLFERHLGIRDRDYMLRVFRTIDKLDKIGLEGVYRELETLGLDKKKRDYVKSVLETTSYTNQEVIDFIQENLDEKDTREPLELFNSILENTKEKSVKIDLSLMRGLDYYTGMIYEAIVEEPRIGSISGGGRYDNLIGSMAGGDVPAVGGSIGVERLIDAGIETGLFKLDKKTTTLVGVIPLSDNVLDYAWSVASRLRREGVNTYMAYNPLPPRRGIEHLEKRGLEWGVFVGEKEKQQKTLVIRNLPQREIWEENLDGIKSIVKKITKK